MRLMAFRWKSFCLLSVLMFVILSTLVHAYTIGIDAKLVPAGSDELIVGSYAYYSVSLYNTANETYPFQFFVDVKSPSNEMLISRSHEIVMTPLNVTTVITAPSFGGGQYETLPLKENGVYGIDVRTDSENILVICGSFANFDYSGNYTSLCPASSFRYSKASIQKSFYIPTPQEQQTAKSNQEISESVKNQTSVLDNFRQGSTRQTQAVFLMAALTIIITAFTVREKFKEAWQLIFLRNNPLIRFFIYGLVILISLFTAIIFKLAEFPAMFDLIGVLGIMTFLLVKLFVTSGSDSLSTDSSNYIWGLFFLVLLLTFFPLLMAFLKKLNKTVASKLTTALLQLSFFNNLLRNKRLEQGLKFTIPKMWSLLFIVVWNLLWIAVHFRLLLLLTLLQTLVTVGFIFETVEKQEKDAETKDYRTDLQKQ